MSIELRREYLIAIQERYKIAPKKVKSLILNEFCANCPYSRKYAIRILNGKIKPRIKKPGPKPKYNQEFAQVLFNLWLQMKKMCSKNLKAAFPLWLPFAYNLDVKTKELLMKISASTIDRLLKPFKERFNRRKGISTTVPAVKHKIPIKLLDGDVKQPGFIEADTVAHCGESAAGSFVNTLTMTDLYSGWTENRATWTKSSSGVLDLIKSLEKELPFRVLGFACDNGTEFLNENLYDFWNNRFPRVEFVRRRPYKKNDAAHVEQKNFTHVRELFGYNRFDYQKLVTHMNEIYRVYWNPLCNFFTPVMKLVSKQRIGSKIVKKYDQPKTPYQRLLESSHLSNNYKKDLRNKIEGKNPFYLHAQLTEKLKLFKQLVEELNRYNSPA
jgi:hypothetical protein